MLRLENFPFMPNLILEVGTEEMPAGAIASALEQLKNTVERGLKEARLGAENVIVHGTPRRLLFYATGVPARQSDEAREVRGPAAAVAFDTEGKPTNAAIGFARKQGVPVESLRRIETPQGDYVQAHITDLGKPAVEVLGTIFADAVRSLFFPKMMRWGTGGLRFVRPIRWLLGLLDSEVVPYEIGGIVSGRESRGHRFLAPDIFPVPHADALWERLRAASVLYDAEERRNAIREQADVLAAQHGGRIPWDEGLLDENTYLVEYPTAFVGTFDAAYLELPRPVLVTAMKKHQKFFPVEDANGQLLPLFVAIRNGGDEGLDLVRDGNERILTARFSDARFFFEQDRASSLDAMSEQLSRLVFQEKLGTLSEKSRRLVELVGALADGLSLDTEERPQAVRAAQLAKADLTSHMVIELPALQGIMGREYARAAGEPAAVADAIAAHYLPRSANDTLPEGRIGTLLAVADRLDTLVGYVGLGILPSGSSDPYGLRRAAQGVVQMLAREADFLPLVEMEVMAAAAYERVNGLEFPLDPLCSDLGGLFNQRMEALLQERGVRYDLIDATLSGGTIYSTLVYAVIKRGETLQKLADAPDFVPTVQAAARVANILRSAERGDSLAPMPGKEGIHGKAVRAVERAVSVLESVSRQIVPELLTHESERHLYETATMLLPEVARRASEYDFEALYHTLGRLHTPVNQFFDSVMVMVEDDRLRTNRIALLTFVDALYKTLADFTRVVLA